MNRLSLSMGVSSFVLNDGPPEPAHRRTGSKVWAGSQYKLVEAYAPIDNRLRARLKHLVRKKKKQLHQAGKRDGGEGTLSVIMCEVFDVLIDFAARGQELAVKQIAGLAGCTSQTVHRAKKALKAIGVLDWIRQCVSTGLAGRRGPQVKQIPNRYLFPIPAWAAAALARWKTTTAPREDEAQEHERLRREKAAAIYAEADRADALRRDEAESPTLAKAAAKARRELAKPAAG